jgi:hypothetical protein
VVAVGIMLKDMIEAPHPLHSHSRSTSYICYVFQHLLLVVIRMQPQPDILGLTVRVVAVGDSLGLSLGSCCRM